MQSQGNSPYTAIMFRPLVMLLSVSLIAPAVFYAQQPPTAAKSEASPNGDAPWIADAARRRQELIDRNGPGTDASLQARLIAMRDADQDARGIAHGQAKNNGTLQMASNMAEIDAQLTSQLKEIVAKSGWPTIKLVGIDASNGAMLVLTHTKDHAWQLSLLPLLEKLADEGRIDGLPLAFVIDKELVAEGKLQRYGTQFTRVDSGIGMYGVEDPGGLDAARTRVGLPPIEEYKKQLEAMYHLTVTGKIVMAPVHTAPAK